MFADSEVLHLHDLKTHAAGLTTFIRSIWTESQMPLSRAHAVSDAVEKELCAAFERAEVIIHQDPAGLKPRTNRRGVVKPLHKCRTPRVRRGANCPRRGGRLDMQNLGVARTGLGSVFRAGRGQLVHDETLHDALGQGADWIWLHLGLRRSSRAPVPE